MIVVTTSILMQSQLDTRIVLNVSHQTSAHMQIHLSGSCQNSRKKRFCNKVDFMLKTVLLNLNSLISSKKNYTYVAIALDNSGNSCFKRQILYYIYSIYISIF